MISHNERALVIQARGRDAAAFGDLVRLHQNAVFGVCYRFLGNRGDAEDLAQEAFIRAYERLHTFDINRPFGPWIKRVAANLCINHLKRNRPELVSLDPARDQTEASILDTPERAYDVNERKHRVTNAILSLPTHYRAVIELRHFHDMSYAEIAKTLDLPLSDVKSNLFRARKQLGQWLKAGEEI